MKQKLALISALMRRPRLLVLDEPFVGLDPAAAHLLKGYLAQLCREGGAVFFSTHVLEVAEKLCHTIAIIRDGRLVRYGPTQEVVGDSSLEDVFLELSERGRDQCPAPLSWRSCPHRGGCAPSAPGRRCRTGPPAGSGSRCRS